MLVSNTILKAALSHFNDRNNLIKQLDLSSDNDKNSFYKLVLAFWLGSNITRDKIIKHPLYIKCEAFIDLGYSCILVLDKQMSLLKKNSLAYTILQRALFEIIRHYNDNYLLLTQNPKILFSFFSHTIEKIDSKVCEDISHQKILEMTQNACLAELSHPPNSPPHGLLATRVSNDVTSLKKVNPFNMGVAINKLITENFNKELFFPRQIRPTPNKHITHKLLIPAWDGIVLEGLSVKERKKTTNTVVLALIGHFQTEHHYLNASFDEFQELFGTELVLINHRNYSNRSNKFANSAEDIAKDVIAFVNHFRQKNKKIVLYGMCGGAAHMILAAHMMLNQKIPFKLIVDRFSQKYINFVDFKTLSRARDFSISKGQDCSRLLPGYQYCPSLMPYLLILLFLLLFVLVKTALVLTKTNIDFAKLVRMIPEEDLLILQAKGEKIAALKRPLYTDMIVHPENDMRAAVKDKRKHRKTILKNLCEHCLHAAGQAVFSTEMQKIFLQLFQCFDQCLQLISNEKLMEDAVTNYPVDLHSKKIYTLTTRNKLPVSQFIRGFFKQPSKKHIHLIESIKPHTSQHIVDALKQMYVNHPSIHSNLLQFANHLALLLQDMKANQLFISYMADHLSATQLSDLSEPLNALLTSDLFRLINMSSPGEDKQDIIISNHRVSI
ncbi:hypothetical protein [Legionella pneumophila]|uniref:Alpha/beta hydrolase n=1 Tax=Legionella pneumophila subsp. pascullei TaxID=91890 RepID=A0AAX2IY86_LEGPN|nr:hypothetical protein [Legionella pneumophila]AMP89406.1 hypothetical protein AXF35_06810 [Legionella pneumophila subsp. pascullei]AMP92928.1 hypothetical protein AXF36_09990 [Legionella pneumophila subsp. pascullei]AMP95894.1 hypothetical protein AXF37_09880 [Legionella pneumophila subsp. pascullei]SQG90816.1 Uncharacterised protein [Legionella pneumophila subsp. pascullei]VEH07361.1 Uncharacterised protein [Legionella pneumophila subsp. pascullei]